MEITQKEIIFYYTLIGSYSFFPIVLPNLYKYSICFNVEKVLFSRLKRVIVEFDKCFS